MWPCIHKPTTWCKSRIPRTKGNGQRFWLNLPFQSYGHYTCMGIGISLKIAVLIWIMIKCAGLVYANTVTNLCKSNGAWHEYTSVIFSTPCMIYITCWGAAKKLFPLYTLFKIIVRKSGLWSLSVDWHVIDSDELNAPYIVHACMSHHLINTCYIPSACALFDTGTHTCIIHVYTCFCSPHNGQAI